jgi:hypothetical protein
MELNRKVIALYGRFSAGERERLVREIAKKKGIVARDLTRRSDVLVIGALATPLIDAGALATRLRAARARNVPVLGEDAFARERAGDASPDAATLPLSTALGSYVADARTPTFSLRSTWLRFKLITADSRMPA